MEEKGEEKKRKKELELKGNLFNKFHLVKSQLEDEIQNNQISIPLPKRLLQLSKLPLNKENAIFAYKFVLRVFCKSPFAKILEDRHAINFRITCPGKKFLKEMGVLPPPPPLMRLTPPPPPYMMPPPYMFRPSPPNFNLFRHKAKYPPLFRQKEIAKVPDEEEVKSMMHKKRKIDEDIEKSKKEIEKRLERNERVKQLKSKLMAKPSSTVTSVQLQCEVEEDEGEQVGNNLCKPISNNLKGDLILSTEDLMSIGSGQTKDATNSITDTINPTDVTNYAKVNSSNNKLSTLRVANQKNWTIGERKKYPEVEEEDDEGEEVEEEEEEKHFNRKSRDEAKLQWTKVEEKLKKMLLAKDKTFMQNLINNPISTKRILMQKLLDEHRIHISEELVRLRFNNSRNDEIDILELQEEEAVIDLSELPAEVIKQFERAISGSLSKENRNQQNVIRVKSFANESQINANICANECDTKPKVTEKQVQSDKVSALVIEEQLQSSITKPEVRMKTNIYAKKSDSEPKVTTTANESYINLEQQKSKEKTVARCQLLKSLKSIQDERRILLNNMQVLDQNETDVMKQLSSLNN